MGLGIDAMTVVAKWVATLPGAVGRIPAIPAAAFVTMVLGGLWLTLWRARWRVLGLAGLAIGLAMAPGERRPDVLIGREGLLIAARLDGRQLSALPSRGSNYDLARWLEHDGDGRPTKEVGSGAGYQCDTTSCVARVKGRTLAFVRHAAALPDDCAKADVIVMRWPRPAACGAGRSTVIDLYALRDLGSHALFVDTTGVVIRTVGHERGERPWSQGRRQREAGGNRQLSAALRSRLESFAAPPGSILGDLVRPELDDDDDPMPAPPLDDAR